MNCVLIIPALEPPASFPGFIRDLKNNGFSRIVVVNDGTDTAWDKTFDGAKNEGAVVLSHPKNKGKGEALKTAFRHCLDGETNIDTVITADCDGQHKIDDIKKVFYTLEKYPDSIILGARCFDGTTPKRSLRGNQTASFFAKSLYGIDINDTQTGLRGIPYRYVPGLLGVKGKRYEYELNMLIDATQHQIPIRTVPVETIYINENAESHYKPIYDTLRISLSFLTYIRRKA